MLVLSVGDGLEVGQRPWDGAAREGDPPVSEGRDALRLTCFESRLLEDGGGLLADVEHACGGEALVARGADDGVAVGRAERLRRGLGLEWIIPPSWPPGLLWVPRCGISAAPATCRPMADRWPSFCAGTTPESFRALEAVFSLRGGRGRLRPSVRDFRRFARRRLPVAIRRRCRRGPPVTFRHRSADARILALEPLCGPLALLGQYLPSGLRRLSPRLCGRFSAAGHCFRRSAGFLRHFGLEFAKIRGKFFFGRPQAILVPPGQINPVMGCHPSRGVGCCGHRSRGFVAGLSEFGQVALDRAVRKLEYLGDFRHRVVEFDQHVCRLVSALVVVVGLAWVPAFRGAGGLDVAEDAFAELLQAVVGAVLRDGAALGVGERVLGELLYVQEADVFKPIAAVSLADDGPGPPGLVGQFDAEAGEVLVAAHAGGLYGVRDHRGQPVAEVPAGCRVLPEVTGYCSPPAS